jgi:hypothetical protein
LPSVESDPFVTPDGKQIYFISTRGSPSDPHPGDFDIFSVKKLRNGDWGEPVRLPGPVNSDGNEFLPRTDRAGNLYFRSDRLGGLGLGEIYSGRENKNGAWVIRNVGAPINTPANEVEAHISADGRQMIVTAERPTEPAHLYRYKLRKGYWVEVGPIQAKPDVYQVGPLLSPKGDRLLFAQTDGARSGELFLTELSPHSDKSWPPRCG